MNKNGRTITYITAVLAGVIAISLGLFGIVAVRELRTKENPEKETTVPEETTAPETTVPEETTEEPSTEPVDPYRKIHALTDAELAAIDANYDTEVHDFGTWQDSEADENNCPVMLRAMEEMFSGIPEKPVTFYCGDVGEKKVSFIFQAIIPTAYAEDVLDILEEYGIKSPFFINNFYARRMPETVERMIYDGHEIGNASYSSPDGGIASQPLRAQMDDAIRMQEYMDASFDYIPHKYSFSNAVWSEASVQLMAQMGFQVCFDSCDYEEKEAAR